MHIRPEKEVWENDQDRMELMFVANDVKPAQQVATLLTLVGSETYGILKDLITPAKPKDKTYEELCAALEKHFSPPTLTLAERFKFGVRNQKPEESIGDFAKALRRLTTKCNFGNYLDDALCLRFVCGLRDTSTPKRLLVIKDPTFKDVLDTAIKCESAEQHTSLIQDLVANDGGVFQMSRRNTAPNCNNNNRNNRADRNKRSSSK